MAGDQFFSRVNTSVAPVAQRDPAAFKSGLAEGLQELGSALGGAANDAQRANEAVKQSDFQIAELQRRRDIASATARAAGGLYDTKAAIGDQLTTLQNNSKPGAEGYSEQANEAISNGWQNFLATLPDDPEVRNRIEPMVAEASAQMRAGQQAWAAKKKVTHDANEAGKAVDGIANGLYSNFSPRNLSQAFDNIDAIYGAMDVDGTTRAALTDSAKQRTVTSAISGLIDGGNYGDARKLLGSGVFDTVLDPRQRETLANHADVKERGNLALQKSAAHQQIALLNARIDAGEDVSDGDLAQGAQLAAATGDTVGSYKLDVERQKADINRKTQGWLPQDYDSRIAALAAKGDKRTAAESIELKQLQAIAPARIKQVRSDPSQWAAANGHPAPTLDLTNVDSIAARRQWAAGVATATGLPTPLLTSSERETLTAQAGESEQARVAVINQVANIGAVDRSQAVNTMRQVLPGDDLAAHMVLLNPANRAGAFNGAAARKADRTLIDDKGPDGSATIARSSYDSNVAPALGLMRAEDSKAVYDLAGNMYADWATKNGVHSFNEGQFDTFLQVALGARKDADGSFHGGVGYWRNQPVLLPSALSQAQFEQHLGAMRWGENSKHAPVFSNGTVMTPAQVRQYQPVARPDGRYEFHGPGDVVLHDADHRIWTIAIDDKGVHP